MRSAKLVVAVSAVLMLAQLHCVAACTADVCGADMAKSAAVPPCHRHHSQSPEQSPPSCSFHTIVSSAISPHVVHLEIPAAQAWILAPAIPVIRPAEALTWPSAYSDTSPPGMPPPSSAILRI